MATMKAIWYKTNGAMDIFPIFAFKVRLFCINVMAAAFPSMMPKEKALKLLTVIAHDLKKNRKVRLAAARSVAKFDFKKARALLSEIYGVANHWHNISDLKRMSCAACEDYPRSEHQCVDVTEDSKNGNSDVSPGPNIAHQRVDVTEERKNWPTTLREAVKVVINTLPPDERNTLRDMPEDELIKLHLSLGMWIRNNFGLWRGNLKCDAPWRADEVSMTIIIMVWKKLQRNKY